MSIYHITYEAPSQIPNWHRTLARWHW